MSKKVDRGDFCRRTHGLVEQSQCVVHTKRDRKNCPLYTFFFPFFFTVDVNMNVNLDNANARTLKTGQGAFRAFLHPCLHLTHLNCRLQSVDCELLYVRTKRRFVDAVVFLLLHNSLRALLLPSRTKRTLPVHRLTRDRCERTRRRRNRTVTCFPLLLWRPSFGEEDESSPGLGLATSGTFAAVAALGVESKPASETASAIAQ